MTAKLITAEEARVKLSEKRAPKQQKTMAEMAYDDIKENIFEGLIRAFNRSVRNAQNELFEVKLHLHSFKQYVFGIFLERLHMYPEITDIAVNDFVNFVEENGYTVHSITFDEDELSYFLIVSMEEKVPRMEFDPDRDVKMVYF